MPQKFHMLSHLSPNSNGGETRRVFRVEGISISRIFTHPWPRVHHAAGRGGVSCASGASGTEPLVWRAFSYSRVLKHMRRGSQ